MKTTEAIRAELDRIAAKHRGVLKPEHVVDAARDVSSPLHSKFCWDDTKAANEYRLWQARMLIRVVVHVIASDERPDRVWVSLRTDRTEGGGGYRKLVTVLSDAKLRSELLNEAVSEMEYFQEKYQRLQELAAVFKSMRRATERIRT